VPHVTGADFRKLYGIDDGSPSHYALTYNDFTALAQTYGRMGGLDRIATVVKAIRAGGAEAGVVCFPDTPLAQLEPVLKKVAVVNPLGVDPRKQKGFQDSTYQRIADLVGIRRSLGAKFVIQADGGIWEQTRDGLVDAGADELVGGYPIFSTDDYAAAIGALRG